MACAISTLFPGSHSALIINDYSQLQNFIRLQHYDIQQCTLQYIHAFLIHRKLLGFSLLQLDANLIEREPYRIIASLEKIKDD